MECIYCRDEHYNLHGCCSGRECGCLSAPVLANNCLHCNPNNDKPPGEYVKSWLQFVEFIKLTTPTSMQE